MSQLKAYTHRLDEVLNIGKPTEDLDKILGVGTMLADQFDLIVFVEGPVLQKWRDADGS